MTPYQIEKYVWSDEDFEVMGWHDASLWSMYADPEAFEFMFDLDYIFKWVDPEPGETYFKFWVCPVTMVFANVSDVIINIESQQGAIEVADLLRTPLGLSPNGEFEQYAFHFECQEGQLSLKAAGFKMYVRQAPVLQEQQSLEFTTRGGVSFGRGRSDA
jgi:hypothetical protein